MKKIVRQLLGLTVLTLTASAAPAALAQAKDKFVYGVPSAISSAIANFAFAKELGYFDQERVDVEFVPLSGSGVIIPQLLAGQIHAAGASMEPLVIARQPGKQNFPLKFVYNYLRNSVWEFVVPQDSPITSLSQLKGKTIGVVSLGSGNVYTTRAILNASGVDAKSVALQPVGFGGQAIQALRTNQVQVLNLWDSMHTAFEVSGTPLRRLPVPKEFQGMSSHGFEVTDKLLKENPQLIARFGRAVSKGSVACEAAPANCLKAFWKHYPALKPKTGTEEEIMKKEMAIMKSRLDNIVFFRPGDARQYGAYSDTDWKLLIASLKDGGEVTNPNVPMSSLYTNELVPEYNKFDIQAVIRQAKEWK
ncbi:ABC transporter substrate-binding protein [Lacisediminimonas sp.]|uniref:ABC transporter substrate-binding protein n=1 Tax=Lacisediminimonas sp. TaxID=3060582 RepID=UPI0027276DDE|nr:ABC transporter substrate-binding protein [Lacisediminimonas sp.]MDO8300890.1 ABC transporter substrate-binding protein [Lacisediminimonas sp.]